MFIDMRMEPDEALIDAALNKSVADIAGNSRRVLQEIVREEVLPAFERRFESQGPGWTPLNADYAERRRWQFGNSSPILDRHRGAIGLKHRATRTLAFWEFSENEAWLDDDRMRNSNVGYGFIHMTGGPIMPQRTWVNMSEGELSRAQDRIVDFGAGEFDRNLQWIF